MTNQNIIQVDLVEDIEQSFLDYAMSVITDRAIPDITGLKPVHRRILYSAYELGLTNNKPHKKSARIVGEVIAKWHPHGDSSVYDAMVRMAQDFSMRYPLIDGQGNMGTIDGDPAAASRYTEARLSKIAFEMLRDINKNVVNTKPNFSDDEQEPVILPSRIPNLLLNGTTGIGVSLACSFPPHHLGSTIDMIINRLNSTHNTVEELLKDLQKTQGCSIMLITHDLGVIAEMADEVVVMYAGKVIERGTVREIFNDPRHPYTIGLLKSKPVLDSDANEPLYSIPGSVPNPINLPDTCFFKDRCNKCIKKCDGKYPGYVQITETHSVSCYLYEEESENGKN